MADYRSRTRSTTRRIQDNKFTQKMKTTDSKSNEEPPDDDQYIKTEIYNHIEKITTAQLKKKLKELFDRILEIALSRYKEISTHEENQEHLTTKLTQIKSEC